MGLEEKKVNRLSRIVLNLMRLEVLLGIALILWTLNLAAQTNEHECPSTMEAILAEQGDKQMRQNEQIIELLEGMQSN